MAEQPGPVMEPTTAPCVRYPGFEHPEGACGCFHGGRPPVHTPLRLPRPRGGERRRSPRDGD
jgi:hypothetical protein